MDEIRIKRWDKSLTVTGTDSEGNICVSVERFGDSKPEKKWIHITASEAKQLRNFLNKQLNDPMPQVEMMEGITNTVVSWKNGKLIISPFTNPKIITAEWLMGIHTDLDLEEAENFRVFLAEKTFSYKECYGGEALKFYNEWVSTPKPTPPNQINQCVCDYNRHGDIEWAANLCSTCNKPITPVQ